MTPNEKALIEDLFSRLRSAAPSGRDAEAENAITAEMARSPAAAYALVQTVLVQDQALREAHAKIRPGQAAAQQAPQQRPSFLDRAGSALRALAASVRGAFPTGSGSPVSRRTAARRRQGGGFLSGALQTAAGVAGGALLFEGVRSMFGGGGGLLGGGGPWGGGGTTVNETIINEAPDRADRDDRDDDARDVSDDSAADDDNDDDSGDWSDDGVRRQRHGVTAGAPALPRPPLRQVFSYPCHPPRLRGGQREAPGGGPPLSPHALARNPR